MDKYYMDCHCHISVEGYLQDPQSLMDKIYQDQRASTRGFFNVMSTYHLDLEFLSNLIDLDHRQVLLPYFGIHPWYSHLFSTDPELTKLEHYTEVLGEVPDSLLKILPDPIYLEDHIQRILELIDKCRDSDRPYAIGEIGLDKLFRVPTNGYYGNQNLQSGVSLTAHKVLMDHQKHIFLRQLKMADDLEKPVSLHCVKAHGMFFDLLNSSFLGIPAVVLHSYSGSTDVAKRWIKAFEKQKRDLYFSFSNWINGDEGKFQALVELMNFVPDNLILFETDLPIDRFYLRGDTNEYFEHLDQIHHKVCKARNIDEGLGNYLAKANSHTLHKFMLE